MHSCLLVTIILACSAWLNACVTAVYQPLSSLRQPVGIDIRKANFNGFAIDLRCQPGALLDPDNANRLCQNVSASLERQGARVQIDQANEPVMDSNETGESENKPDPAGKAGAARDKSASIKLVVELTAKRVRALQNSWYGPLSFYTLTLIPLISDFTDEQRIVIRDENGFVLADQTFQIRIIEYMGLGYSALNAAANFLFRTEEEKIVEGTADRLVTKDLHRQLSQIVMNAGARQAALKLANNNTAGGN